MAEELSKRGMEGAGDDARMQLVADMSGDAERDAMRDAAAFVEGVRFPLDWSSLGLTHWHAICVSTMEAWHIEHRTA